MAGRCMTHFTTCRNVGQLHSHPSKFFSAVFAACWKCSVTQPPFQSHLLKCWAITQSLFQVFFPAVFATCWNVGQLHSHPAKFFLSCIYNLPKYWLVTQPLFWVFSPSCNYNLPKCCLVTQPLFWVSSPLYLQPAKMLFDYTATLLSFCSVAFSYLWDIVWHLPNLLATPSPTHLPCWTHCNPDPHPTVSQLVVHSDLPCWPHHNPDHVLLATPFTHHPTVGQLIVTQTHPAGCIIKPIFKINS